MSQGTAGNNSLEKYKGNCHCGAFQFSVKTAPVKQVRKCNCSICVRNGYLWLWPISDDNFIIRKGEGTLKKYEFGSKTMAHMFCPKCGTSVMARRHNAPNDKATGINVRSLINIDLTSLEIESFKGADLDPPYQPPKPSHGPRDGGHGLTIYDGNCHCGAVRYTVQSKPLNDIGVMSCNCSLCSRNSDLWIYPKKAAVDVHGWNNLTDYIFLHKDSLHSFCSTCGVSVLVKVLGKEEGDDICPINVRTINGIDLGQLKLKSYDGAKNDPQYVVPTE